MIFDARAQQKKELTGVGMYTRHLALNLLKTDLKPNLTFFQNAQKKLTTPLPPNQTITTKIPNKLLNTSITFFKKPNIQKLCNKPENTPLFLPNINFIATSAPHILTVHDLSFKHFPQWYTPKMRAWHKIIHADQLITKASHLICVSNATAQDVQDTYHIPSSHISVIHPGIHIPTTHKTQNRQPYLLAIGSIEPRKNQIALLHAFARIIAQPQHTQLELKIIGPTGHRAQQTLKLINQLKIEKNVSYLGYVTEQQKHNLLANAHAFVYPSLFEGFGFPLLEAMSHGTPVITSWSSSLKEVCGNNALLINPYNYDELVDAIRAILEDEQLHTKLSQQGKQHAAQFTWNKCAQQTSDVLKKLL